MIRLTDLEIMRIVIDCFPAWDNWSEDSLPHRLIDAQMAKYEESNDTTH